MTRRPRIRINPAVTDADEQRVVQRIASTLAARQTQSIGVAGQGQKEAPAESVRDLMPREKSAPSPAESPTPASNLRQKISFHVCVGRRFDARVADLATRQGLSLAYVRKALIKRAKASPGFQNPKALARAIQKAMHTPPQDQAKWFSSSITVSDGLLVTLRDLAGDPLNVLAPATLARAFLAALIEGQDLAALFRDPEGDAVGPSEG